MFINEKKAGMTMLIYKVFIRIRNSTMDKDVYFRMTKGSVH